MAMEEARTQDMLLLEWNEFGRRFSKEVDRLDFYNKLVYFSRLTCVKNEEEKMKFEQLLSIFKNPNVSKIIIPKDRNRKKWTFSMHYIINNEMKTVLVKRMANNFCDGWLTNGIIAFINETCSHPRAVAKYADYEWIYIYPPRKKPIII